MHQVDERVPLADLLTLTAVYQRIIEKYFDAPFDALTDQ
jgi:acetylornithine deacetylase/succinyl-diaminopimelate desuccinylase-like protein